VSTVLTAVSIAIAFLLFGLLQGTSTVFDQAIGQARADRLQVANRTSGNQLLPLAHLQSIEHIVGVSRVAYATLVLGSYRNPITPVRGLAVDIERYFGVYSELHVTPEQLTAMARNRTGVLVGEKLARRLGWKIGDRIPIQARFWRNQESGPTWTFDIVGIFDSPGIDTPQTAVFLLNQSYFDEARTEAKGMIGGFIVQVTKPQLAAVVGRAIDEQFTNSGFRTRTQSENELARARLREIGDIQFIVNTILGAVFFTLILVTSNSVSQSVSERIPEFGALKAIGFSDSRVFTLILMEVILLFEVAAMVGLLATIGLFGPATRAVFGPGGGPLPPVVLLWGALLAAAAAVVSVMTPGLRAMRLTVAEALASR
jgi:putative ABC transport system permease protein